MDAIDVMRLIDLIADLDTPSASDLRAFADRALVQVQSPDLRIGIATDGGRPIGELLALVDGTGSKRDVWSIASSDRPGGVDAWILVVAPDQDLSREGRFLERIGDAEKVLFVAGGDRAAVDLGFPSDRIFGAGDLAGLERLVDRWKAERDELRRRVLSTHARPVLDALARDRSTLDERHRRMPDADEAESRRAAYEQRSTIALDALTTAAGEVVEEIRQEIARCFSDWIETVTANYGDRPNRERVQESLEKWLRERFVASFGDRLRRRLGTHADNLEELRAALSALERAQTADLSPPAVNVPERAEPTALRWLLPLAGGGVGYWRGGPTLALIGAALGLLIARLLKTRAKRPLRDKALRTAAANHIATHLDAVAQRTIESLRADCALELERLTQAARAAESTRPERDRIQASLEQLEKARSLLELTA